MDGARVGYPRTSLRRPRDVEYFETLRADRGGHAPRPWGEVALAHSALEPALRADLEALLGQVGAAVRKVVPGAAVEGRVKPARSSWQKMARTGLPLADLPDLLGLRVVVGTEAECTLALAAVRDLVRDRLGRVKDYIARPKPNGYRSLHATVLPGLGPGFELQVRTREMHEQCERGPASHRRYKAETSH